MRFARNPHQGHKENQGWPLFSVPKDAPRRILLTQPSPLPQFARQCLLNYNHSCFVQSASGSPAAPNGLPCGGSLCIIKKNAPRHPAVMAACAARRPHNSTQREAVYETLQQIAVFPRRAHIAGRPARRPGALVRAVRLARRGTWGWRQARQGVRCGAENDKSLSFFPPRGWTSAAK